MSLQQEDSGRIPSSSQIPRDLSPNSGPVDQKNGSQNNIAITPGLADRIKVEDCHTEQHQHNSLEPVDEETSTSLPVLKNNNFLTLWGSQVLSQVADKIYLVFMIALITEHYQMVGQSVSGWVSAIMIAFTIPAVVFGSIAGVMVDWWPKKRVLVLTNLMRGILVFTLPIGFQLAEPLGNWFSIPVGFWMLLGITFLVSTLTQFFAPAEQSTIPLIVEKKQLLSANSFYTFTMMAAVILGFAAGDPLLSTMGSWVQSLGGSMDLGQECLVGGAYILAGLILCAISIQENLQERTQTFDSVWADIQTGFDYISKNTAIRSAIIQLTMLFSILAALAVLVVRLAEILPEIKTSQFGFLLTAGGLGMTIGLGFLSTLGDRYSRKTLDRIGSVILASSLFGMAFSVHSLAISLLLLLGIGVGAALIGVPMQTIIQERTPEEMRGKVFGLQNNLVNIALSLPLALAGIAETWLGIRVVFIGLSTLAVTSGLINWYISRTQVAP